MKTLTERIQQGKEAIAKAKAEGKDTTEWEKHLAELEKRAIMDKMLTYWNEKSEWLKYPEDSQRKQKALELESEIHTLGMKVVEGKAAMAEWTNLVEVWTHYMDGINTSSLKCSICGRSHNEIGILLDITYFKEERTVCKKCYKRLP